MNINSNIWQGKSRLAPVPDTTGTRTVPTAEALSGVGSGSFTGRQLSFTSQYRFIRENNPAVELRSGSPANAISVQNSDAFLSSFRELHPLVEKTTFGSRYLKHQNSKFNQIGDALIKLREASQKIRGRETFNIRTSTSTDADVVSAKAAVNATTGKYDITITQIAASHQLGSSEFSIPGHQLGYSGTIKINGRSHTISTTDTLYSIRDLINHGEDLNQNGMVDREEDLNGNDTLDVYRAQGAYSPESGYINRFYYNEDIDGDGTLDSAEDTNGNDRLDGDSFQTGVRAIVADGQLVLITDASADIELRFSDPDEILENLGFIFRNDSPGEISVNKLNEQTVQPQRAKYSVEGKSGTAPFNVVNGAIPGVSITLKSTGSESVKIGTDTSQAVEPVRNFTVTYSDVLKLVNSTIIGGGALSDNAKLKSIQTDTVRNFFTPPPDYRGAFKSFAEIGISEASQKPSSISQTAFENMPHLLGNGLSLPGPGEFSIQKRASRLGINSEENYTAKLDSAKLERSLKFDSESVDDLLSYAASRLQKGLERHLRSDYGTIRFQQDVNRFYGVDDTEARDRMAKSTATIQTQIAFGTQKNIFKTIA